MRKLRHPLSGAIYEIDTDGLVLVTGRDGRTGRFTGDGVWVGGDLKQCDPHVCVWVGGPQLRSRRDDTRARPAPDPAPDDARARAAGN